MGIRVITSALLLAAGLFAGCSEKSPNDPNGGNGNGDVNKDEAYYTAAAWESYGEREFQSAVNLSDIAINMDSTYAPAICSRAYANLELGYTGLALREFEEAIGYDSACVECWYGASYMAHTQAITFTGNSRPNFEKTVNYGEVALDLSGDGWIFAHNDEVNATGLRVLLARTYYALADYDRAHDIVDLLDPNNTLNPSEPGYLQDLLLAVEGLGGTGK